MLLRSILALCLLGVTMAGDVCKMDKHPVFMSGCREYVLSLKYRFFNDFSLYLIPLMNSRGNDTVFKFQLHLTDIGTRMDWTYFPAQEQYSMIMSDHFTVFNRTDKFPGKLSKIRITREGDLFVNGRHALDLKEAFPVRRFADGTDRINVNLTVLNTSAEFKTMFQFLTSYDSFPIALDSETSNLITTTRAPFAEPDFYHSKNFCYLVYTLFLVFGLLLGSLSAFIYLCLMLPKHYKNAKVQVEKEERAYAAAHPKKEKSAKKSVKSKKSEKPKEEPKKEEKPKKKEKKSKKQDKQEKKHEEKPKPVATPDVPQSQSVMANNDSKYVTADDGINQVEHNERSKYVTADDGLNHNQKEGAYENLP